MSDEVVALNHIADMIQAVSSPYMSLVGMISTIILTAASIIVNYQTSKQNNDLQKQIHNRDISNQTRQLMLNIYDSYLFALYVLSKANNNVETIFMSETTYRSWLQELNKACDGIIRSQNQINILVNDKEMMAYLKKCHDSFLELTRLVNSYIANPILPQTNQIAWTEVSQRFSILAGDFYSLNQNPIAIEELKKKNENSYTKSIQNQITNFNQLLANEQFDNHFKKIVQIQEIE